MPPQSPLRPTRAPLLTATTLFLHASILLLFAVSAHAQSIDFGPATTAISSPSPAPITSDLSTSTTTPTSRRPHTTLFSSITAHNASTHNASTSSIDRGSLPLGPAAPGDSQSSENQPTGSGVLNYYFAFLAVFIVILFLAVWYIHRRKKRMKALRASSRQNALTRDLDGWAGGRRWVGGAFRGGFGRQQEGAEHSREEGLNELGEAPPPYKARDSVVSGEDGTAASERRRDTPDEGGASEVAVPLSALDREGRVVNRPPDYHTTAETRPSDITQPNPAAQRQGFTRTNISGHASGGG